MRIISAMLGFVLMFFSAKAQMITFSGKFDLPADQLKNTSATLYKITGIKQEVLKLDDGKYKVKINEAGAFSVQANSKEAGLYRLVYQNPKYRDMVDFYLFPGQKCNVDFSLADAKFQLSNLKDQNAETRLLNENAEALDGFFNDFWKKGLPPQQAKDELGKIEGIFKTSLKAYKRSNDFVRKYLQFKEFFTYAAILYDYPGYYNANHKDNPVTVSADYFQHTYPAATYLNDEFALMFFYEPLNIIDQLMGQSGKLTGLKDPVTKLKSEMAAVGTFTQNQKIKDAYNFLKVNAYVQKNKAKANDPEQVKFVNELIAQIGDKNYSDFLNAEFNKGKRLIAGAEGYNFSFEDSNGKKYQLKDFAGKLVYVDVWATWCGPCKKEKPHLDSVAKMYKGKDIVFVGISTDSPSAKEKWKSMIAKDENVLQLYAGDRSAFAQFYEINGIPRFILFDKQGKLINHDAPRPSSKELGVLLTNSLEGSKPVKISGLSKIHENGAKVYLYRSDERNKLVDSATVSNGIFSFELKANQPAVYSVRFQKPRLYAPSFLVNNTDVQITVADDQSVVIKGDNVQEEYTALLNRMKPLEEIAQKAGQRYSEIKDVLEKARYAEQDTSSRLYDKMQQMKLNFIKEHSSSVLAAHLANESVNLWNLTQLNELLGVLGKENHPVYILNRLKEKQQEFTAGVVTGKPAFDFELKSIDGTLVKYSELKKKSKYILIDFWASWCAPCRNGNKKLSHSYEKLKAQGLTFVSISMDQKEVDWKKAVKEDGLPWVQLILPNNFKNELAQYYKVKSLPSLYLIGPDNAVVAQNPSHEELEKRLAEK